MPSNFSTLNGCSPAKFSCSAIKPNRKEPCIDLGRRKPTSKAHHGPSNVTNDHELKNKPKGTESGYAVAAPSSGTAAAATASPAGGAPTPSGSHARGSSMLRAARTAPGVGTSTRERSRSRGVWRPSESTSPAVEPPDEAEPESSS